MKKPLIVTLADKKYLEYAKQVFAGAYFNAGWKGDYLLLAHECEPKDTIWFKRKGILVKHCRSIYKKKIARTLPVIISKLYLFTPEFKKWSHIVYIDADVIIRGSLENLTKVQGFASLFDVAKSELKNEIVKKNKFIGGDFEEMKNELEKKYNFDSIAFGAGFFVLNTKLIQKHTFNEIKAIIDKYNKIAANADQFALNLYFYKKWQNLPAVYDFYLYNDQNQWGIANRRIQSIIIHFCTQKPWEKNNYFFPEWKLNYERAEQINLKNIPEGNIWSPMRIILYNFYLSMREKIYPLKDLGYRIWYGSIHLYYLIVIFWEKNFPGSFKVLKTTKAFFKRIRSN